MKDSGIVSQQSRTRSSETDGMNERQKSDKQQRNGTSENGKSKNYSSNNHSDRSSNGKNMSSRSSSDSKNERNSSASSSSRNGSIKDSMDNRSSKGSSRKSSMQSNQLMHLFEAELKDIYWAEKALTKAIPKMVKRCSEQELIDALNEHLEQTENQVTRLEQVFEALGKKPVAKKCEAMAGLIEEGEAVMDECEDGPMCDAGIIASAQKIEHYEIASYGTLRQFAKTLGLNEAAKYLDQTLKEEKNADTILTDIAVSVVNIEAADNSDSNSHSKNGSRN